MNTETGTTKLAPERDLYGKLVGVVQSRQQLKTLCESLAVLGIEDVEAFDDLTGIAQLEKWKESVSQYLFGDTEGKTLQRYLDAVKNENIVFTAVVKSSAANNAAETAKSHDATDVTHFGNAVVTRY